MASNGKLGERVAALEQALGEIKVVLGQVEAREAECIVVEDRLSKLERLVQDVASSAEACRLRLEERDSEWPVVGKVVQPGGSADRGGAVGRKVEVKVADSGTKVTVSGLLRGATGKVLVTGDSLARGMGHKLREQCGNNLVEVAARGGATLAQVADSVAGLRKDDQRQLVVVAGANSMKEEPFSGMLENFYKIIEESKKSSRSVVVVGLVKRYDLGRQYECKRIVVNARLKGLCKERGVSFLEYEPERSRVHKDGLHLNYRGQWEMGRKVFGEVKSFLKGFLG